MSCGLWMVMAIPVIAAGEILHFKMKEQCPGRWNILPKCLATWMMVCTAVLGIIQSGNQRQAGYILAAMILFLIADGCLEVCFFVGMGVFAAGHLALIAWFVLQGHFSAASIPVWFLGTVGMLLVFKEELSGGRENPALYLMALYPAVLMAMTAMAVLLPFTAGKSYVWPAFGAVLFTASDMMVGKDFFGKLSRKMRYLALAMYYLGIFCLSMGTWIG